MVAEVVDLLRPERGGVFLDATVGGGGHAQALLAAADSVRLVGLDEDPEALIAAEERLSEYGDRVRLRRTNFRHADEELDQDAWLAEGLAGALMDLGISSKQIDESASGFSFRPGTPLVMRMGGTTEGRRPAADLLNSASESELGRIFREFGEERRWKKLAREVVRLRGLRPFGESGDLVGAVQATLGPRAAPQDFARIFQAVRIAVNDELAALEEGLSGIRDMLRTGGRLAVISYHSLEDRIVKRGFREWSRSCICPPELPVCRCRGVALGSTLTKRPLRPTHAEVSGNPRARSAKLRVWERA
jgi:16S rRNA (cytosine1402-N4)-methyltransferase